MTSRFSAASALYEPAANAQSAPPARVADEGPYARPATIPSPRAVDAVLIDAIRASVGPFVPAQWRSGSGTPSVAAAAAPASEPDSGKAAVDESEALPWIESFIDTATEHVEAPVSEAVIEPVVEAQATTNSMEEWPLEEAGAAMRALADDLVRQDDAVQPSTDVEANSSASPESTSAPMRMWSDDDIMDIMPVKNAEAPTESGEQWAARARRETEAAGSPESAARALEMLARRVRSGEIQLPAFSSENGEAAALAAALAALLSVRR